MMKKGLKAEFENILPRVKLKDILQIIIGASILAVPVGFTEETWRLGESLPIFNILGLFLISLVFISFFVYYHYHKGKQHKTRVHVGEFVKRVFVTYIGAFVVVAILLALIQRTPWMTDFALALKRTVIVTFPSSMSATVADVIK
jgi:uncharacterized membrane protein